MRSFIAVATAFALGVRAQLQGESLEGTWSSGSGAVQTGNGFCSPQDMTFNYPQNTGISYSFTADGFFEEAQYRYDANATDPQCIRGKIIWQHGKYEDIGGKLVLTPFHQDGRIQVQDPCAAETNVVTYYNQIVEFRAYAFSIDPHTSSWTLNLNAFDGAKLPPLYLKARPPNMLPTQQLTGANETGQTVAKRDVFPQKRSDATINVGRMGVAGALVIATTALSLVF